jgi:beta-glucosidase
MSNVSRIVAACLTAAWMLGAGCASAWATSANQPWMDSSLPPDVRAEMVLKQMSLAEKQSLVHGIMPINLPFLQKKKQIPADAVGSAGYVPGISRLGIPPLQETDASLGIANPMSIRPNDVATALPSSLATASSFDPAIAYAGGATIGREAHEKGFNVLLAGGANLARDPRNGRNFEYLGEDPLLAGLLGGAHIRGIQDQHVISTIKHYAVNDQETNRHHVDFLIGEAAMRESDLLAFEIAIEDGKPGSVMCSYNLVNGAYGCGNDFLLNKVLKGDWRYSGWVMSDWGAVHELDYAMKGLDQQSAAEFDIQPFFAGPLTEALKNGSFPESRLDDMARRILHSMFAVGVIDHPPVKTPVDAAAGAAVAQKTAEAGTVLLKNMGDVLPVAKTAKKVAVIGGHADFGVLSGGGSSQVIPAGSMEQPYGGRGIGALLHKVVYHPSSPLEAIKKLAPQAEVKFADGHYTYEAVKLAKWADIVIVFATKWQAEGSDAPDLTLPDGQDALIDTVASINAKTVVVLETGNPVVMPWLPKAAAVLEAWYPGIGGGEAIANVLFGAVDPSGRLPLTFPADISQNPRPVIPGSDVDIPFLKSGFDKSIAIPVHYTEGADIGYRWMAKNDLTPLFPFGYGLSYTRFTYRNLKVYGGATLTASFDVTNTGKRPGADVPQLYLTDAAGRKATRLLGFTKLELKPGETRHVTLTADRRLLADYDVGAHGWKIAGGSYRLALAKSASDPVMTASAEITTAELEP